MVLHQVFLLLLLITNACSVKEHTERFTHQLGATNLQIERTVYAGSSPLFIVHVHDNETTAQKAAEAVLKNFGGTFLTVKNSGERLLHFSLAGKEYIADPNRIFTQCGRALTLKKLSRYHSSADSGLQRFASFFLEKTAKQKTIVAVHNNSNDAYSILSYIEGGDFFADVKDIHINWKQDKDDFFITTWDSLFSRLKAQDFNVVLQQNQKAFDDGSLSIYYGQRGEKYVNVEAEHGHLAQQIKMLKAVHLALE